MINHFVLMDFYLGIFNKIFVFWVLRLIFQIINLRSSSVTKKIFSKSKVSYLGSKVICIFELV